MNQRQRTSQPTKARTAHLRALFAERMMLVLLALLVSMMFLVPLLADTIIEGELLVDIMLTAVLIIGTLAVVANRRVLLLLALCSSVAVALRWSEWFMPHGMVPLIRDSSMMLSLFVLSVAVGINVFGSGSNVANRLIGAVVLYLLIASIWASAYLTLSLANPQAFSVQSHGPIPMLQWFYFSVTTLTTLGYGDIVPLTRAARALAMVEGLIGQLYPAIILARLVAADLSRRR